MPGTEKKQILFLDGIRGIAALTVLIYHYLSAIYPEFINGSAAKGKEDALLVKLGSSPLNIFTDGNLAVAFFFLMSGFVLSYAWFLGNQESIRKNICKRFFRLAPPVFASVVLTGYFLRNDLFFNHEAALITGSKWLNKFYKFDFEWWKMLKQALYSTVVLGKISYNHTLWTVRYEFWGVFLVALVLLLIKGRNARQRLCIYIFFGLLLFNKNGSCYLAFVLGTALCDIVVHCKKLPKMWLALFLIYGLYFASYPAEMDGGEIPWYYFMSLPHINKLPMFWHILGAFLLLLAVFYMRPIQKFFEFPLFRALGRISYSFYAVGFVIQNSIFCFCFVQWYPEYGRWKAMLYAAGTAIPITLILAVFVYYTFECWGKQLAEFVYRKFEHLK